MGSFLDTSNVRMVMRCLGASQKPDDLLNVEL